MKTFLLNKAFRWFLYLQILVSTTVVAQWVPLQYPGVIGGDFPGINDMDFMTANTGVAVSDNGLIIRTTNGGVDWDTVYTIPESYTFKDIMFYSDARAVAVGHKTIDPGCVLSPFQGIIATSLNNGITWDTTSVEFNINAVDFPTAQLGFIAGDCGHILRTDNAGDTWAEIPNSGTAEDILNVSFVSESIGFFALTDSSMLRTTTGTSTWDTLEFIAPLTGYLKFFNDLEGVTIRENSPTSITALATVDGGDNWDAFSPNSGNKVAHMFDHTRGYFSNNGTSIIAYINESGNSIDVQQSLPPTPGPLLNTRVIHFFSETIGYAAGDSSFYRIQQPVHNLSGVIYDDQNLDCLNTLGEPGLEDWIVKAVKTGGESHYTTTDNLGNYSFSVDTGTYTISTFLPNSTRELCDNEIEADLTEWEGNTILDIGAKVDTLCPVMEVDIATAMLTRCTTNTYYVFYQNNGTTIADNPHINLLFDEDLEVVSSMPDWTDSSGSLFTYNLEDLMPGDSGRIKIEAFLACDATIEGQTHGVTAKIFPDNICDTLNPLWDQSSVKVSAECVGDSATLLIRNTGTSDMQAALEYIVIEDHILLTRGDFDLGANLETAFVFYPNGGTLRLEANQSEGHPGRSMPSVSLEGCGTDENGDFSLGFVNQDPEDDLNPFISIEQQESIDTNNLDYQNQIFAYPKGYGIDQFILPNTSVEYRIPFQAPFPVSGGSYRILSLPSEFQEIATIVPGASSHLFDFSISSDTIHFIITEDLAQGDIGFIKFRIDQKPDNTEGTPILHQFIIDIPAVDSVFSSGSYLHNVSTDTLLTPQGLIISGTVFDPAGQPVDLTEVYINESHIPITDNGGYYEAMLPGYYTDSTLLVRPSRKESYPEGISAYDLYLLHEYIAGRFQASDSMQLLAADWDKNGLINLNDLKDIQETIGLSDPDEVAYDWRFIPVNYDFENGILIQNPVSGSFSIDNPTLNNQANFKAIKRGDFNASARANNNLEPDTTDLPLLKLSITDRLLEAGQSYDIPFLLKEGSKPLLSFQWMANYDPAKIEISDLLGGGLYNRPNIENLSWSNENPGTVIITWYKTDTNLNPDSIAFQLKVRAKENFNLTKDFISSNGFLFPEAFVKKEDGTEQKFKIVLESDSKKTFQGNLNITPNPARGIVFIDYQLDQDQPLMIRVFDALGKLVRQYDAPLQHCGDKRICLDTSMLTSGVYFIYLETDTSKIKAMKKLVIIE